MVPRNMARSEDTMVMVVACLVLRSELSDVEVKVAACLWPPSFIRYVYLFFIIYLPFVVYNILLVVVIHWSSGC